MTKISTTLLILLILSVSSYAQLKRNSNLFTFDIGTTSLIGTTTNNTLTGFNANFVYDYVSTDNSFTGGFSIGYMHADDEASTPKLAYSTIPIVLQGKYFPVTNSTSFYLEGGIGLHFSRAERIGNNILEISDSGLMLLAGLGTYAPLDDNFFLKIAYNFSWLDSQSYQNGVMHSLKLGFAFN